MFRRLLQWLFNRGSTAPAQVITEIQPVKDFVKNETKIEVQQHNTSVIQAVKPHVPLIKFPSRTGSKPKFDPAVMTSPSPSTASTSSSKSVGATPRGSGIDPSELPPRYWRRPISAEEMEFIEKGGPV